MRVQLHPHQKEAVAKMHNGCVLYGDVGVGKTITSLAYYFERVCNGEINKWGSMQTPKDVYVITTAKVRDGGAFEAQAGKYGIHTDRAVSTNEVKIHVDSWNNLHKYVEVEDAFFIFDEQRVVGYGAWSRAFIKIAKSNEWILLSATPGDTWMDYIPVFIANGWYKHKTDFTDQHVIWTPRVKYPKVLRYQNVGKLVRRRNEVLVHMPYEKHTKRHAIDIWCDYDQEAFDKVVKKRWHVFEKRPLRDVAELFIVMRKVVNSDESRLEAVSSILRQHPRLIVFYNFDYELEMLRTLGQTTALSTSATIQSSSSPENKDLSASAVTDGEQTPSKERSSSKEPTTSSPIPESQRTRFSSSQPKSSLSSSLESSTSDSSTGSGSSSKTTSVPAKTSSSKSQTLVSGSTTAPSTGSESEPTTTPVVVAEWNGHKHEEIPNTDSWVYLVQYRAGAEGWNCVSTDAICFYSQTYSYRDWHQAHGRIDRINTPYIDLWYYHLVSSSLIDKAIRKALKAKKSFNEKDLKIEVK